MNSQNFTEKHRDYGVLSDLSKSTNYLLGDKSGRSVSMRTAHGLKNTLAPNISDNAAEDIVHIGMIASGGLVFCKNDNAKLLGCLLLLLLILSYQAGR